MKKDNRCEVKNNKMMERCIVIMAIIIIGLFIYEANYSPAVEEVSSVKTVNEHVEVDKTKVTIIEKDGLTIKKDYKGNVILVMGDVYYGDNGAYYNIIKENVSVGSSFKHVKNFNFGGTVVEGWASEYRQKVCYKFEVNGTYCYVYISKKWAFDYESIVWKAMRSTEKFYKY